MVQGLPPEIDDEELRAVAQVESAGVQRVDRMGQNTLHRVVVVGGGAAGLELVTRLGDRLGRRAPASITLVECGRAHLWKPLLHAVAAGSIDPGESASAAGRS